MDANGERAVVHVCAEKRVPLIRDGRPDVVWVDGTYEYVEGGIEVTSLNDEVQRFRYHEWRIEIAPLTAGDHQ